ncbi:MAG: DUF2867 domain-containing protein [bacterium]
MAERILVTGATGYIGGRLIPRLLEAGYLVRAFVRDPARLALRPWMQVEAARPVEVVAGDALTGTGLDDALRGCDRAYYLIHSMAVGEAGFAERDRLAARHFGEAAARQGVQQIIYLGGLGAGSSRLSQHLTSRHETGAVLRAAGSVPVTEFRAAVIVGAGSLSFEMIRYLTERLPVMPAPRWVGTRVQPIGIVDLLSYLMAALTEPRALGQIVEIGGADILTYGDMMLGYAAVRGLRRYIIVLPVLTPGLSSRWVDLVTPIPRAFARPLIEGLRNETIVTNNRAHELFPQIQPETYQTAVARAIERTRLGEVETSWTGALPPNVRPGQIHLEQQQVEGLIVKRSSAQVAAPPRFAAAEIFALGGERGWLYANALWQIRGGLDRLAGGVGMRRGRRHPTDVVPGDALDFWRVEQVIPGEGLLLRAEMKLPGNAWLRVQSVPDPAASGAAATRSVVHLTSYYAPFGLAGLLYWYLLLPFHDLIFAGMTRALALRAEGASRAADRAP